MVVLRKKCQIFLNILIDFYKLIQVVLFFLFGGIVKIQKDKMNTFLSEGVHHIMSQIRPSFEN